MKDKGETVKVLDTRLISRKPLYYLKGAEAEVLRACRNVIREDKLVNKLSEGYEEAKIREALALPIDRDTGEQRSESVISGA